MNRIAAMPQDDLPLFTYKLAIGLLGLVIVGSVDLLAAFCPGSPLATLTCTILAGIPLVITRERRQRPLKRAPRGPR